MRRDKIEIKGLESILIETNGNHLFRKSCSLAPLLSKIGRQRPMWSAKTLMVANLTKVAFGVLDLRRLKMEYSKMKIQKFV